MSAVRQPTTKIAYNLRWTRSGVVWADYLLTGIDYGYRGKEDKRAARNLHRMLARALPGESLLRGVCASLNPLAVVERMERGINLDLHPAWDAECDATVDTLSGIRPGQRLYWLSIPLTSGTLREQMLTGFTSAVEAGAEKLGVPASAVPREEVERRRDQADRIVQAIPSPFAPIPATPAQMVWLWHHDLHRGLSLDADLPDHVTTAEGVKTPAAFTRARFDEGAQLDRPDEGWRSKTPTMETVLRVDTPWALDPPQPSYQVYLCLSDLPSGGTLFPGSEFLSICDAIAGFDVDWAMRLTVRSSEEVRAKNRRSLINLNEQFNQREGETSHAGNHLAVVADELAEYDAQLEADRMEVEVEWTTIFSVGAPTADEARRAALDLQKEFESSNYTLVAPMGFQQELFWACVPGFPTPRICREFRQNTTSYHWSAYVPCVRNDLGDATGPLLAINISNARLGVVHHNVEGKAARDVSGSMAVTGNLGSGKSVLLKTVAANIIDRGGQAVVIDSTPLGEYEKWARSITDATVVNVGEPDVSLDPLRMFVGDQRKAAEVAGSVLLPMMGLDPADDLGSALSQVLSADYRAGFGLTSLADVADHLADPACEIEGARELHRKLAVFMRDSSTDVLFRRDLPILVPEAPAIVFRTHKLSLPTRDDVLSEHLFRRLSIATRVGHIMYQLLAELAREICFADPNRLAVLLCDEAHRFTSWQRGTLILAQFIRDGRKHGAAVLLGSQDPEADFGDETMRGLIPTRIVMRQTDETLARKCLRWLGAGEDPVLLKELMEQTSPATGVDGYVEPSRRGEGYMRDAMGNLGRIKALAPSMKARFDAVTTTPKERSEAVGRSSVLVTRS
ncbi:hypothetical protein G6031_02790 [Dietzia sp. CQ4]|uniref:ATP-binding protein n=1 Tax=Dietzia sp. (strain CQ4) TaxID=370437 RepID=UPI0015F7920D|nr:ATP-binding protein [Dietzia sp. CQ4]MBB1033315.1 hypothetical protein [Dietzia sp. CQ4]